MAEKRLRVFAGPNGSGKTTLFESIRNKFNPGYFINADLLEKTLKDKGYINLSDIGLNSSFIEFDIFYKSSTLIQKAKTEGYEIKINLNDNILISGSKNIHSYEAAFVAAFIREQLIKAAQTFSFETVLSHSSKIEEIKLAKKQGYKIYLYYISVESPIISQARVVSRVEKGGHPVNPDRIVSRYFQTLEHLASLTKIAHRAYFFDNSGKDILLLAEKLPTGDLKEYARKYPQWFHKYVIQKVDF